MPAGKPMKYTLKNIDLSTSLVPFGGTAKRVDNPDKTILGGKGLGLQEMSRIGVDVPPGFTLTTPLCQVYQEIDDLPEEMWTQVRDAVKQVEKDVGKVYGATTNPLLFSCRSGAAISMPGMMDTVLNIVSIYTYESYSFVLVFVVEFSLQIVVFLNQIEIVDFSDLSLSSPRYFV